MKDNIPDIKENMETIDERLQFALRFAQMALPTRKAEWDKLRRDIAAFVDSKGALFFWQDSWRYWFRVRGGASSKDYTEKELADLQEDVRRLLVPPLVIGQGIPRKFDLTPVKITALECGLVHFGGRSPLFFLFEGDTHDLFLGLLLSLLMRTPVNRIRSCLAPSRRNPTGQCGKIFLRIGRKIYCSETCTNRTNKQDQRRERQTQKRPARKNTAKAA
jgi:hypothetical protein